MKRRLCSLLAPLGALFLGVSCVGVTADIRISHDGSGVIDLEYRIPSGVEGLGRLDGNAGWPIVPVGRADFERTAARIEGLRLRSYSARESGGDCIYTAKFSFTGMGVLVRFLGEGALWSEGAGLSLTLSEGREGRDPELGALFAGAAAGRFLSLSFSLPAGGELFLQDRRGESRSPPAGAELLLRGRRLSFKAPLEALLSDPAGLTLKLRW
jgi:hypothetical protein